MTCLHRQLLKNDECAIFLNMLIFPTDNSIFFDVDDTLVLWSYPGDRHEDTLLIDNYGCLTRLLPHKAHISQLIKHKNAGHSIVVWSQGGVVWATNVVKALKLEEYVDVVMCKPFWYYDDIPMHVFMPEEHRVYYKWDEYKPLPQTEEEMLKEI